MRKAAILTALLLVLSIGGVCVAALGVYEARDQVVLTETVVYGDRAVANGLTVELNITCADHLFWDTTCTLDAQIQTRTEYSFSALEVSKLRPRVYSGISLDATLGSELAKLALYNSLEPGEEKSAVIYLKDYMDYYPISVSVNLPGITQSIEGSDVPDWDLSTRTSYDALLKIRDYFKIPVLEEECYKISVWKGEGNNGSHYSSRADSSSESDYFSMKTFSVPTGDACYFTFDAHTWNGKLVDLHEIPGGYGIYRLPYQADEVDADALEMVYPLDPETKPLGLFANEDQTRLLLHAVENGKYILTVIDLDDMTTLQKLEIAEWPKDQGWRLYSGDGCMAVLLSREEELAVIAETDDGDYELWYMGDAWSDELGGFPFQWEPVLAFDGERLAFIGFLSDEYGNHYYYTCDFALAVYEPSGLEYYGEYGNSLDTGKDVSSNYRCRGRDYDSLTVSWAASD